MEVTLERLRRIDRAEQFLRDELGLRELRVRHEANDLARIEVPAEDLVRIAEPDARRRLCDELHRLGFKFVCLDLEGFRSGSMNAVVAVESLQQLNK